jgi:hypothetical protein
MVREVPETQEYTRSTKMSKFWNCDDTLGRNGVGVQYFVLLE